MLPPTLVPASPATTILPPATAATLPPTHRQRFPGRYRVTVNLSVDDARNFSYLLRDIHVCNGERGHALEQVRIKLARQLKRYSAPQPAIAAN